MELEDRVRLSRSRDRCCDSSVQLIFFWEIFHFEIETIVYLEMHDRPDKCKVIDPSWHAHISFSWVAVVAQLGNHRIWPTILRNWLVSYTGYSDDSSSKSPFPYFRRTFRSRISLFFVDQWEFLRKLSKLSWSSLKIGDESFEILKLYLRNLMLLDSSRDVT